jgi:cell division septum initiation protein DivIVA
MNNLANKTKQNIIHDYEILRQENEALQTEVISLQHQLEDLNENTVISSMNDMKEKYEHLVENTVSINDFLSVKDDYLKYLYLVKTLENINKVILNEATCLNTFVSAYTSANAPNYSKEFKKKRIAGGIAEIKQRLETAKDIIESQEETCSCNC